MGEEDASSDLYSASYPSPALLSYIEILIRLLMTGGLLIRCWGRA